MACNITFDNVAVTGVFSGAGWSTNGIVEYLGYATTAAGPFGAGGNWPWATNIWGASQDVGQIETGFYQFKYKSPLDSGDPCYGEITFIVPIVQGTGDAPTSPVEISICSSDAVRNIYADSGLYAVDAVNPVTVSIAGNGTSSPGYSAGSGSDLTDDTYDPSQEVSYPVVLTFELTYTPAAPPGYTLNGCTNCDPVTIDVIYTVNEEFQTGTLTTQAACNDGDI